MFESQLATVTNFLYTITLFLFRGGTVSGSTEAVGESESYADSDTAVCWGDPGLNP